MCKSTGGVLQPRYEYLVVSRLGLEPRALALKGELPPPLNTTHHEISHTSAHQLHFGFGLSGGRLGWVHGQNTDKESLDEELSAMVFVCSNRLLQTDHQLRGWLPVVRLRTLRFVEGFPIGIPPRKGY